MLTLPAVVAPDPNWLLSTTVQSAAALVAIIGGFLVSRLVTLSSEQAAVRQRAEDLETRLRLRLADLDVVHVERLKHSRNEFIRWNVDDVVAGYRRLTPEDLLKEIPFGSTSDEMQSVASEMLTVARGVTEFMAQQRGQGRYFDSAQDVRRGGFDVEADFDDLVDGLATHYSKKPPGPFGDFSAVALQIPNITSIAATQRQDSRIERERSLKVEVSQLQVELDLTDSRLRAFAKPEGVVGAIIALTWLAASGIVFPEVLMAWRPIPNTGGLRVAVVSTFVSGLVVLLIYFLVTNGRLRLGARRGDTTQVKQAAQPGEEQIPGNG